MLKFKIKDARAKSFEGFVTCLFLVLTRNLYIKLVLKTVENSWKQNLTTAWKVSIFGVILVRIQSKCGKIRTRITPEYGHFLRGEQQLWNQGFTFY